MEKLYLVTGAAGHLGNTILNLLSQNGKRTRALVLASDQNAAQLPPETEVFVGDVCDPASMEAFFSAPEDQPLVVIHCAGIVTIASKYQQAVYDVNVGGVRNVVELCARHHVAKLVYVSSVHSIPELPGEQVITEIDHFDPENVIGLYAKTKAEATACVLEAARNGLDASVVHPSGLCGPYDYGHGHLTQLVTDWYKGRLTAGIDGGYDFADVRDVAQGIVDCCEKGRAGECYILSGHLLSVRDIFELLHQITGHKRVTTFLPLWFVKLTAPLSECYYKLLKQTPLYTAYSLYTLESNAHFSHDKATRELGYETRPFEETLRDTVDWLKTQNRL